MNKECNAVMYDNKGVVVCGNEWDGMTSKDTKRVEVVGRDVVAFYDNRWGSMLLQQMFKLKVCMSYCGFLQASSMKRCHFEPQHTLY